MPHVLDSLLSAFRETAAGRPDRRDGRNKRYEVSDAAGCAPACFFTRCESFLAFQRRMERDGSRSNCRTLFGAGRIPCDNRIRNLLDDLDPAACDPLFRPCLATVAAQGALEPFQRLDERLPAAPDGVRFHRSDRVHCPQCSVRRAGSERRPHHFHAMAVGHRGGRRPRHGPAADARVRVPAAGRGRDPRRHERGRAQAGLRAATPPSAGSPLTAPGCRPAAPSCRATTCTERDGKRTCASSFFTGLAVTADNAERIARAGRARWKIENEGFNCLARHGRNFKRNFGHGKEGLANVPAVPNLFAFALHAVLQCVWCSASARCGSSAGASRSRAAPCSGSCRSRCAGSASRTGRRCWRRCAPPGCRAAEAWTPRSFVPAASGRQSRLPPECVRSRARHSADPRRGPRHGPARRPTLPRGGLRSATSRSTCSPHPPKQRSRTPLTAKFRTAGVKTKSRWSFMVATLLRLIMTK